MSIEALKWALDIGEELGLEPARRLVLIMLGNSADPAGCRLFPSHGYISRRTGLAKSTVRAHVTALVAAGLMVKEPRHRDDRGQTSNNYRLAMKQPGLGLDDTPLPDSSRGGAAAAPPRASQPAGGGSHSKELKQEEKSRRGTRLPPAWKASPELQAWARAGRPWLDLAIVTASFIDHWTALPGARGVKLDWDATFRNWVRKERPPAGQRTTGPAPVMGDCGNCGKQLTGGWTMSPKGRVCPRCHDGYMGSGWPAPALELRP